MSGQLETGSRTYEIHGFPPLNVGRTKEKTMQWRTAKDLTDPETMLTVRVSRLDRWGQPPEFSLAIGILNTTDDTMKKFFSPEGQIGFLTNSLEQAQNWIEGEHRRYREEENKRIQEDKERKTKEMEKRKHYMENRDKRAEENRARASGSGKKKS